MKPGSCYELEYYEVTVSLLANWKDEGSGSSPVLRCSSQWEVSFLLKLPCLTPDLSHLLYLPSSSKERPAVPQASCFFLSSLTDYLPVSNSFSLKSQDASLNLCLLNFLTHRFSKFFLVWTPE